MPKKKKEVEKDGKYRFKNRKGKKMKFLNVFEKENLFEDEAYRNQMIDIFNIAIKDELSASAFYISVANQLKGFEVAEIAEEFIKQSKEEYEHFTELFEYASKKNIIEEIDIGIYDYFEEYPIDINDIDSVIEWKQYFEKEARDTYIEATELAESYNDEITRGFFLELANDEQKHIDDILQFSNIGMETF